MKPWKNKFDDTEQVWKDRVASALEYSRNPRPRPSTPKTFKHEVLAELYPRDDESHADYLARSSCFVLGELTPEEQEAVDRTEAWRFKYLDNDRRLKALEARDIIGSRHRKGLSEAGKKKLAEGMASALRAKMAEQSITRKLFPPQQVVPPLPLSAVVKDAAKKLDSDDLVDSVKYAVESMGGDSSNAKAELKDIEFIPIPPASTDVFDEFEEMQQQVIRGLMVPREYLSPSPSKSGGVGCSMPSSSNGGQKDTEQCE